MMSNKFVAACAQTTSGPEVAANIEMASDLVRRARDKGADFIGLPEVVNVMDLDRKALAGKATVEADDPMLAAMRELAGETGAWILIGSIVVKHDGAETESGKPKFANRSILLDAKGEIQARYDKIHMFDVDLEGGESYRESSAYEPGDRAVLAETPWAKLGMTICYDLRFPYLYRGLAKAGASMFTTPAAFTVPTGKAHWHILHRARAIENGCFVIAPAQCGHHGGERYTYGHSLIVAPWGEVLADGGEESGVITAEIDLDRVAEVRGMVPSLTNDRDYIQA
jgi:predicted amidohydrolase